MVVLLRCAARLCLLTGIAAVAGAQAQASDQIPESQGCRNDLSVADGYTVAAVHRNIRFLPLPALPVRVGDLYDPVRRSTAGEQLAGLLDADEMRQLLVQPPALTSRVQVRVITSCVRVLLPAACMASVGQPRCVSVTFSDYFLGVGLDTLATYAANEPRPPYTTFFAGVPRVLRLLNPSGLVTSDNRAGTSPGGAVVIDLLNAPRVLHDEPALTRPFTLTLSLAGSRAVQHDFFSTTQRLDLGLRRLSPVQPDVLLHVEHRSARQPLGTGIDASEMTSAGVEATLHPSVAGLRTVTAWSGFQAASHTVQPATPATVTANAPTTVTELDSSSAVVADGHTHGLLMRNALWFKASSPSVGLPYQQLALTSATYRDFAVAPNQAIGVKVTGSYGTSWGLIPAFASFHAGNNGQAFLFDDRQRLLTELPNGPVIRSLGTQEGARSGVDGTASFVGLSGTMTIPLRRWSRPLIPNVQVTPTRTLKQTLTRFGLSSSRSLLRSSLEQQGMPHDKAEVQAAHVINQDVAPAVRYLADDANLFAFKPLLAVDWAHSYGAASSRAGASPVALGGGVEATLVNVAVQAGYARTVNGSATTRSGNFFLVLEFRDFF